VAGAIRPEAGAIELFSVTAVHVGYRAARYGRVEAALFCQICDVFMYRGEECRPILPGNLLEGVIVL